MGRERRDEEERERRERREQKTKEREKRRALAEIQRETENVRTFSFTSHLPSSSLALLLFSSFFQFSHAHAQAKRNQSLTPPASRENNGRRPEQQPLGADCIELVDVGNAAVLHHQVVDALAPRRCRLSLLRVETVSSRSSSHRHARDPHPRKGRRHPSLGLPLAHGIVRRRPRLAAPSSQPWVLSVPRSGFRPAAPLHRAARGGRHGGRLPSRWGRGRVRPAEGRACAVLGVLERVRVRRIFSLVFFLVF